MNTLITGATGTVGRHVARILGHGPVGGTGGGAGAPAPAATAGMEIRAASRGGGDVEGVPGVALDFEAPETWSAALVGVDAVFLVRPPAMSRPAPLNAFADAAVEAGVSRIVFLSLLGAERNPVLPHRRIEKHLETQPVERVFLRAGFFMQNLTGPHREEIAESGEIVVPAGSGRTSFIDARDIAAVAVRELEADGGRDRNRGLEAGRAGGPRASSRGVTVAHDLTGPAALTYHEVAAILTAVLGRPVRYDEPSLLRFVREQRTRGRPWFHTLVMAGIYTTARLGLADRVTDDVARLLGRPATPFQQFARDHRDAWQPESATATNR